MVSTIIGLGVVISLVIVVIKGFKRGQLQNPRTLLSYSDDKRIEDFNETIRNRYKFDESFQEIA